MRLLGSDLIETFEGWERSAFVIRSQVLVTDDNLVCDIRPFHKNETLHNVHCDGFAFLKQVY